MLYNIEKVGYLVNSLLNIIVIRSALEACAVTWAFSGFCFLFTVGFVPFIRESA